jgi:hypothetical protein
MGNDRDSARDGDFRSAEGLNEFPDNKEIHHHAIHDDC